MALAVLLGLASCPAEPVPTAAPAPRPAPEPATDTTPNAFLKRGSPTFIVGTAGDDRSDRAVRAQIAFVAGLFPGARVVDDTEVAGAVAAGRPWPPNPVIYGGPHVNVALRAVAGELPFTLGPGRLAIGDEVYDGDGFQLITIVPASARRPELLVYAGTGTPGVTEINGVHHGGEPILVIDAFGRLAGGAWTQRAAGTVAARLGARARRIAWRSVVRDLAGRDARAPVRFHFPAPLPPADDEAAVIDAALRGLAVAAAKLELAAPASMDVYVHPDRGSKRALTGNAGDGHAVVAMRALHVLRGAATPAARDALAWLMAHEGTHILAHEAWGAAGTSLVGEGLAVWVSGRYGGVPLAAWRGRITARPAVATLLGPGFRELPEQTTYPLAGLLVEAAVARVGLAGVRDHLLGATAATWEGACARAGTTAADLEAALPAPR